MAARTRKRVRSVIPGLSLMTAETVWIETLASLATSFMVTLVGMGGENFTASSVHEASCERSCKPDEGRCQTLNPEGPAGGGPGPARAVARDTPKDRAACFSRGSDGSHALPALPQVVREHALS